MFTDHHWQSRRVFMSGIAAGFVFMGTGCLGASDKGHNDLITNTSDKGHADPIPNISFKAGKISQSSPSSPPRFQAILSNEGQKPLKIGYGQKLMYSADGHQGPENLVVVPAVDNSEKQPNQPTDGCWGYSNERERNMTIHAIRHWKTLSSGDKLSAEFNIYAKAENDPCYPEGSYRMKDVVFIGNEETKLSLAVTIRIDEDQQIEVTGEQSGT